MSLTTGLLAALGSVLLVHAVYSAYEHSQLARPNAVATSSNGIPVNVAASDDLPLDITLETLISVVLLCLGLVYGSPDLKPIRWRTWAGQIEEEKVQEVQSLSEELPGNPFLALDQRVGFLDIRAQRKDFARWKSEKNGMTKRNDGLQ